MNTLPSSAALVALIVTLATGCSQRAPETSVPGATPQPSDAIELAKIKTEREQQERNLTNFDDLDFNVYSNQKWDQLSKSHAADIVVHWPDGRTTTGIEPHIEDLKQQFVFAPDTKIKTHPIKIAQGDYTAVTGVMEGTFSKPMSTPDGKTIAPTNKPFKLEMVTIGRWENGVMKEEWLFWDNHAFMQQIGLAK
ncbi:MAG TPA: ester cyclase [Lysobacter sp.]|jgi:hypothetical protein|nr:ester cyclase [Lysobacter sp.]